MDFMCQLISFRTYERECGLDGAVKRQNTYGRGVGYSAQVELG